MHTMITYCIHLLSCIKFITHPPAKILIWLIDDDDDGIWVCVDSFEGKGNLPELSYLWDYTNILPMLNVKSIWKNTD